MRRLPLAAAVLTCAALLSVFGCSPDSPVSPTLSRPLSSALVNAPAILTEAESGTLGRGEQDLLVRFERQLPGFGGLYIANGAVRVYMKTNTISPTTVRSVLSRVYSAHRNPRVREAMANVTSATVIQGQYSLSELIAIQKRIRTSIPGWNGVGTNIMANKVVVAFPDSDVLASGLSAMESAGVPPGALTSIIMPPVSFVASYFTSYTRPTKAGVMIWLQNDTYEPHTMVNKGGVWIPWYYGPGCSLGFNVASMTDGVTYFLTAAHCENTWRGANGIYGDTVFQPDRGGAPAPTGLMGTIVRNPVWGEGAECPTDIRGRHFDLCTDSDVALGRYVTGVTGDRKIAISMYGGINGYPGTNQINNYYPINAVLSPEYVDSVMHHQTGKSGGTTYTTSGPYVSDMMDVAFDTCWGQTHNGCPAMKSVLLQNQTVIQADVSGGDSGSAVFTGNPGQGAPYAALGIVSAGAIPVGLLPTQRCPTCKFFFTRWERLESRLNVGTLNPQTVF